MSAEKWNLKRVEQCSKCPWLKRTDPTTIPNGYDVEKHKALAKTIAEPGDIAGAFAPGPVHVMACHEDHEAHCVGWLMNQLGPGNNIALRLRMLSCANRDGLKLAGAQHRTFKETLPKNGKRQKHR